MKKINKNQPIRCSVCGKFIKYEDCSNGKVLVEFTPDTEYTTESTEFTHTKCLNPTKK